MKFFIPDAKDGAQAENWYAGCKELVERKSHNPVTGKRIYSIDYIDETGRCNAAVGKPLLRDDVETDFFVIAIFEAVDYFHVVSVHHYRFGKTPISVARGSVQGIKIFDTI